MVSDRDALSRGAAQQIFNPAGQPVAGTGGIRAAIHRPRARHARLPGHHGGVGNASIFAADLAAKKETASASDEH